MAVSTSQIEIDVPDGAKVGDRLTFFAAAHQFSLEIPSCAMPGKKLTVTMPAGLCGGPGTAISRVSLNGVPLPPKLPPAQVALLQAHWQPANAHYLAFPPNERFEVRARARSLWCQPAPCGVRRCPAASESQGLAEPRGLRHS